MSISHAISIPHEDETFHETDPHTLYVGGNGPGNYTSVQKAIDNASHGDLVFVYSGYYQENLVIDKAITLKGESRETTIINGGNTGDIPCIDIIEDDVIVEGFFIEWSDWEFHEAGIRISSNYYVIQNNIITIHDKGIVLYSSAKYGTIKNNIITDNHEGIYIWPTGSDGTIIENNTITYNDYAFKIFNSNDNIIRNNTISFNNWYGLLMENAKGNFIYKNTFENNSIAISTDVVSTNNTFFHNNMIQNRYHVVDVGFNTWYMEKPVGGNYWSDYTGSDFDHDGFGDEPYSIPGQKQNYDHYPFMRRDQWHEHPLEISVEIPAYGFVHTEIPFQSTVISGKDPYEYVWDFGDGSTSSEQQPIHSYDQEGVFTVSVQVIDGYLSSVTYKASIEIFQHDEIPPEVSIDSPTPGIYFHQNMIKSLRFPLVINIGDINLHIQTNEKETKIVQINLYLNEEIIHFFDTDSIIYTWPSSKKGLYQISAEAIDLSGNIGTDSLFLITL